MLPSQPTLFLVSDQFSETHKLSALECYALVTQGHFLLWQSHQHFPLTFYLDAAHTDTHTHWKLTIWSRGNSIWWKTGPLLGGVRLIKRLWPSCLWNAFFNPADNIILGLYLCSWTYFKHSPLLSLYYILSSPFGIQFHYWRLISYILPFCHSVYCVAGILRLAVPTYP